MKIKDLLEFNPEADLTIILNTGDPYKGKLTYGWTSCDGDEGVDNKSTAKEVCIFLGDIGEII